MPDKAEPEVTDDAVLGGRLRLKQPRRGHRVGHDAILLAAATDAEPGEHAVDLGAGVGAAGLALAVRVPGVIVTLVDVDRDLVVLAAANARRNGLAERVGAVHLDVGAPPRAFAAAGLAPATATRVLMNPPFHDPDRQKVSSDARCRLAHAAAAPAFSVWVRSAARLLRPQGILTLIWRADGLAQILAALAGGFGTIAVLPVHPRPDAAAIRILVRAVKGGRAPLTLLPGFPLNDETGRATEAAEAVLRHAAMLPLASGGKLRRRS